MALLDFDYFCLPGAPFYRTRNHLMIAKRQIKYIAKSIILTLLISFISTTLRSENLKQIISLEGTWRFTVGDDPEWANPNYNDQEWDYVFVPKSWENNGFVNYNGYGWYRKYFQLSSDNVNTPLFLTIGYIDDVDEVYLNGELIGGTGVFPPLVRTAYDVFRKYPIPHDLLNPNGKNVIAVRVYDEYMNGGITYGDVGIYYDEDNELLSYNLSGYWDFESNFKIDNKANKMYGQEDGKIFVPGFWESFGYSQLDGPAIYSRDFMLPNSFEVNELMITLGYIDDVDKVYLNNVLIGKTDDLLTSMNRDYPKDIIFRAYNIPPDLFILGGLNTIKVKVYDTGGLGGIYEGPIGLITKSNLQLLKKKQIDKPYSIWNELIKQIFE